MLKDANARNHIAIYAFWKELTYKFVYSQQINLREGVVDLEYLVLSVRLLKKPS